ncbi:MAG TPA: SRPBCC domain-containing protein [Gaiellaceae bacterium]|nr:SRPBCC domain-containing protein [Gaiellaceae bacterium]
MEIDREARAKAYASIEVAATPEAVWSLLVDIPRWPDWNPQVRSASLEGPLDAGTRLTFRFGRRPGALHSQIRLVEPCRLLAWTGTLFGTSTAHVYRLEAVGGQTRVSSEASWDGLLVRMLSRPLSMLMRRANLAGIQHLKREAEREAHR